MDEPLIDTPQLEQWEAVAYGLCQNNPSMSKEHQLASRIIRLVAEVRRLRDVLAMRACRSCSHYDHDHCEGDADLPCGCCPVPR